MKTIRCETCELYVPREETYLVNEGGDRECILCYEKGAEKREKDCEYFRSIIVPQLRAEKFYREEGLLREDGTWDLDAIRRLR